MTPIARRTASRARVIFAASIVAGVLASLACQGNAVIIGIQSAGIESDGSAPRPIETDAVAPGLPDEASVPGVLTAIDAASLACLADGGCPYDGLCEYRVDAGCGAEGVCIWPIPDVPPPPPPIGSLASNEVVRPTPAAASAAPGYTTTPPECDGGEASDADGDVQDAPGD